jgi:hypothetical protein
MATTKEMKIGTVSMDWIDSISNISSKKAPNMAGMEIKNEKRKAWSFFIPTNKAPTRVKPERENPGTNANA